MSIKKSFEHKCVFLKDNKCNSDYAKGEKCDGSTSLKNRPSNCPYNVNVRKSQMEVRER